MSEMMRRCVVLGVFASLVVVVGVSCSQSSGQGPGGPGIGFQEPNQGQGSKKKGRVAKQGFRTNRPFAVWIEKVGSGGFGTIASVRCLYREEGGSTYLWEAEADPVGNGLRIRIIPSKGEEIPLDPNQLAQLPQEVRNRLGLVPPLVTTGSILITIIEEDNTETDVEIPAEETNFDPCD